MNANVNKKPAQTIILKDITIPYNTEKWQPRNFRGLERVANGRIVNAEGKKNFVIFLPQSVNRIMRVNGQHLDEWVECDQLIEDGWNISKNTNPTDPQADPSYMLRVKVKFHPEGSDYEQLNPKVRIVNSSGATMEMDDENIGDLDNMQIEKANITVRATWQTTPSYTGYVAYLNKLVLRVYEEAGGMDELMEGILD